MRELMAEIARTAPRVGDHRVYLVGGSTAVFAGWRRSSVDADLYVPKGETLRDVQGIKERLEVNVEFARPEHFVPPLAGSEDRHLFIETIGTVSFYHYDPYAQILSKVVRGFHRDLADADRFITSGMVDPGRLRVLVNGISDETYAKYPALSRSAVEGAVERFISSRTTSGRNSPSS
jgi:hypothetical protein